MGWIVVIVLLAIYAGLLFWRQSRLAAKNLHRPPTSLLVVKFVGPRGDPARDDRRAEPEPQPGAHLR